MKVSKPIWKDAHNQSSEDNCPSEDEEQEEQSRKRRRVSHTGLTCEIDAVMINRKRTNDQGYTQPCIAEANNHASLSTSAVQEVGRTKLSEKSHFDISCVEDLMDGTFAGQEKCDSHSLDEYIEHNVNACDITRSVGSVDDYHKHRNEISSCLDHLNPTDSSAEVFEISNNQSNSCIANVDPSSNPRLSPVAARMNFPPDSFVTPGRNCASFSREPLINHDGRHTNELAMIKGNKKEELNDKVFQTPVGNAPKYFHSSSTTKIRFQSPMEISYHGNPRSSNSSPRRRDHRVSTRPAARLQGGKVG